MNTTPLRFARPVLVRPVLITAIGVALTLAACGDDEPDSAQTTAAAATAPASTAETATTGATITIESFAFGGDTEVAVGSTVTVVNNDTAAHTWTSVDGAFDSGSIAPGESFQFTFDEAGDYRFFCAFHEQMGGSINVTA